MLTVFIVHLLYFVKGISLQTCEAENKYPWSYHGTDNDPSQWGNLFPANCSKKYQNPFEINTNDRRAIIKGSFPLQFVDFDRPITKARIQNLGYTVMITPEDDVRRLVHFGDIFHELRNIRFHFGPKGNPGAEHVIDGNKHTMEIQYNIDDAETGSKGFISSHMEVSDHNNPAFDPIIDVLPEILYRNDSTELKSELRLLPPSRYLLPTKRRLYYIFPGSDTIPPCEPDLLWWLLIDVGKIGRNQLNTFMTLYSVGKDDASDDCLMGPNARPLQNIDNRYMVEGPYKPSEYK